MLMENIYNENELNIELIYNMQTDLVMYFVLAADNQNGLRRLEVNIISQISDLECYSYAML